MYDTNWAKVDVNSVPHMVTTPPGPKSQEMHARAAKYMKGYRRRCSCSRWRSNPARGAR